MKKGSNSELKINIQCHWHEGGSVQNEEDTVLDFGIKGDERQGVDCKVPKMSQFKVPVISFHFIVYFLSLSIASQDESNRRVAYGLLFANPMGMGASAPYPVYQQPYYGMAGYPSAAAGPMAWPMQASAMYPSASGSGSPGFTFPGQSYQQYPGQSYQQYPAASSGFSVPGQGGYFGPMAGLSPYSGYSPLTMIGR